VADGRRVRPYAKAVVRVKRETFAAMAQSQIPTIEISPPRALEPLNIRELWHSRGMLYFLAIRDIKVRYRQTILGVLWAVLQPLVTMLIMTIVFSKIAQVKTGNIPYPLFAFTALLPWQLFASCLTRISQSVVTDQSLVTKVYFPRLILPMAAVVAGTVDFCFGFLVLLGLMAWYHYLPGPKILLLPVLMLLAMLSSFAVGTWIAALNTRFRDFGLLVPLIIQVWLFLTPIAYPLSLVRKSAPHWLYFIYTLNPVAVIVEFSRWIILGMAPPILLPSMLSVAAVIILLISSIYFYKKQADLFADFV
jgi:lipopolysaccharide transport system permease protein